MPAGTFLDRGITLETKFLSRPKAYCVLLSRCKIQEDRSPPGFFYRFLMSLYIAPGQWQITLVNEILLQTERIYCFKHFFEKFVKERNYRPNTTNEKSSRPITLSEDMKICQLRIPSEIFPRPMHNPSLKKIRQKYSFSNGIEVLTDRRTGRRKRHTNSLIPSNIGVIT